MSTGDFENIKKRNWSYISFWTHREPWLPRPCPVWPTPPSSRDRTRSVSTRRAVGRARQGGWKWWTRPDTSLDTSTQGHTRRKLQNLHKNPCEILHPAVNATEDKPDSKKHKRISHFPLRVRLFLWITLSVCSSSCKCFISINWNALYI